MDANICPVCNKDQNEGFCEHFVATLCDDGDGFDVEMPLYFGWYGVSPGHDTMMDAVLGYLLQLKQLLQTAAKCDPAARRSMQTECGKLPGSERLIVIEFLNELDRYLDEAEDPDIDVEDLVCELELQRLCKEAFDGFYKNANGKSESEYYEIAHSPGLTWTGTDYWASSGGSQCAAGIAHAADEASTRLKSVIKASES